MSKQQYHFNIELPVYPEEESFQSKVKPGWISIGNSRGESAPDLRNSNTFQVYYFLTRYYYTAITQF